LTARNRSFSFAFTSPRNCISASRDHTEMVVVTLLHSYLA
jgi:hypothetical protein